MKADSLHLLESEEAELKQRLGKVNQDFVNQLDQTIINNIPHGGIKDIWAGGIKKAVLSYSPAIVNVLGQEENDFIEWLEELLGKKVA